MDLHEISHLSVEEKKARFRQTTITHRLLEQTHRKIMQVVREPDWIYLRADLWPDRGRKKQDDRNGGQADQ